MTFAGSTIDRRYMRLVARLPTSKRPMIPLEEMYGTVTDVCADAGRHTPQRQKAVASIEVKPAPPARTRVLSPLVADLERKLAERAGKPRSRPNYVVNVGNPARRGDDDAPRQYPSDGVKVS